MGVGFAEDQDDFGPFISFSLRMMSNTLWLREVKECSQNSWFVFILPSKINWSERDAAWEDGREADMLATFWFNGNVSSCKQQ